MYKKYYKLNAEPFRLTPDPRFVFAHSSYQKAHAYMQHALEQGDGFIVITGRSGTGKTTLVEDLLTGFRPGEVHAATLTFTQLEVDDLLRMVAYAFNVNAKGLDKATLLCELEKFLEKESRALLIIDEAQNLSPAALEEIRMLTNLHVRSQPVLQIFLLGQQELRQRLHKPELEHLHQRLMATCDLEPLNLQETQEYVLHRLNCAGWCGYPAISAAAFVLIHRFSQGLPRYINKLCTRLFLHGAEEQRNLLESDDLVTVINEMQDELLLPLAPEQEADGHESLPDMRALTSSSPLPADWMEYLTTEEQAFIEGCTDTDIAEPAPAEPITSATLEKKPTPTVPELGVDKAHRNQAVRDRSGSDLLAAVTREDVYRRPVRSRRRWKSIRKREILAYGLAVPIVLMSVFVLGYYNDIQQQLSIGTGTLATRAERTTVHADPAGTELNAPNTKAPEALGLVEPRQEETGEVDGLSETENKAKAPILAERIETPTVKEEAIKSVDGQNTRITNGGDTETLAPVEVAAVVPTLAESQPQASHFPESEKTTGTSTITTRNKLDSDLMETQEVPEQAVSRLPKEMVISEVISLAGSPGESQEPPALNSTPPDSPAMNNSESADPVAQTAEAAANAQIEKLLLLGKQAVAIDRLRIPKQRSGWHYYKQVLKLDPGNQKAQRGLEQIAERYGDLASSLMEKQHYEKAQMYINRGLGVVAEHSRLLALQQEIQTQQEALLAMQEREQMLALQEREAQALAEEAERRASRAAPKPAGFLGSLKKLFADAEVQSPEQLFQADDY